MKFVGPPRPERVRLRRCTLYNYLKQNGIKEATLHATFRASDRQVDAILRGHVNGKFPMSLVMFKKQTSLIAGHMKLFSTK